MPMRAVCANFACMVTRSVCPAILLVFVRVARTAILCLCRCCVILCMIVGTDVGVKTVLKVFDGGDKCGDIRWLLGYCCCRVRAREGLIVGVIYRVGVELL